MESVYVESSVISYLAARASREMITAAHQAVGWEWWVTAREKYELLVSQAVLDEIIRGNPDESKRRLELIQDLPILGYTEEVAELLAYYEKNLGLTGSALVDLPHFAFAVSAEINYPITWNRKHIASGVVMRRLRSINDAIGRPTPTIGTPDILLATESGEAQ